MMGRKKREYDDDDGRTIVDMSQVSKPHLYRPPTPLNPVREEKPAETEQPQQEERPWEDTSLSKTERRMYVLGALKSALLIGLVYVVGLGLVILGLIKLWS
ncbi:MAG: hypothetical protein Q4F41_17755 [Eubacteriales bacterium]|nr:hypothetical protein [Eubacteriales bacterium]